MKVLLLGKGVAANGCKRLLDKYNLAYDMLEINELARYDYDLIVKSPGISLLNPVFQKLNGSVISDLELVYRLIMPKIIAITGSNGKTSVTSMIQHVLSKKYKVIACGNIGYTLADAVIDYPNYDYYIVECSSYQLEAIRDFRPQIAIILNVSLCHIDHHGSLKEYVNSKLNIASNLGRNCTFIYNKNIPYINEKNYNCNILSYSSLTTTTSIYKINNRVYYGSDCIYTLSDRDNIDYKSENIMAVLGVLLSLNELKLSKYIKSFKGVEYRFQKIDNGIYNDAKSTNCESTRVALSAITNVHLICGGYDRGIPIILDAKAISHIKHVYGYGQTSSLISEFCNQREIPCTVYANLAEAFDGAINNKNKGDNILYSPMFASYDQYKSYNERGEEFNRLYLDYKKSKSL